MGISGTTVKSHKRKFVPSSGQGPFAVVASSQKRQTKVVPVLSLVLIFLKKNELIM